MGQHNVRRSLGVELQHVGNPKKTSEVAEIQDAAGLAHEARLNPSRISSALP